MANEICKQTTPCLLELHVCPLWVELVEEKEHDHLHCFPVGVVKHVSAVRRAHNTSQHGTEVGLECILPTTRHHDTSRQWDLSIAQYQALSPAYIGRTDREQIRSRINNNWRRMFQPCRPLSTVYKACCCVFCMQLTKAYMAETFCISCYWFCSVDQFAQYQQRSNEPLQHPPAYGVRTVTSCFPKCGQAYINTCIRMQYMGIQHITYIRTWLILSIHIAAMNKSKTFWPLRSCQSLTKLILQLMKASVVETFSSCILLLHECSVSLKFSRML